MKFQLYGHSAIREQREAIQKQLMEIAANQTEERVNEAAMMNVVNKLFNHIEDLETAISVAVGDDIPTSRTVNTDDCHFDKDMFEIK